MIFSPLPGLPKCFTCYQHIRTVSLKVSITLYYSGNTSMYMSMYWDCFVISTFEIQLKHLFFFIFLSKAMQVQEIKLLYWDNVNGGAFVLWFFKALSKYSDVHTAERKQLSNLTLFCFIQQVGCQTSPSIYVVLHLFVNKTILVKAWIFDLCSKIAKKKWPVWKHTLRACSFVINPE